MPTVAQTNLPPPPSCTMTPRCHSSIGYYNSRIRVKAKITRSGTVTHEAENYHVPPWYPTVAHDRIHEVMPTGTNPRVSMTIRSLPSTIRIVSCIGALDKLGEWTTLPYFLVVGCSLNLGHAVDCAHHALMVRAAALARVSSMESVLTSQECRE